MLKPVILAPRLKALRRLRSLNFNNMHKRIILVGKAASGKDHLRKVLEGRGYKFAQSYSTRPARPGEIDGKDYYFLTESQFEVMEDSGQFYEFVEFNGWKYGTTKKQFNESCDVFIMTPHGISLISPEDRKSCFIIYIDVEDSVRHERLLKREMPGDSIERRMIADTEDFSNFTDYDVKIANSDF